MDPASRTAFGPSAGAAALQVESSRIVIGNEALRMVFGLRDGSLTFDRWEDLRAGVVRTNLGVPFALSEAAEAGSAFRALPLRALGVARVERLAPEPGASRASARVAGQAVSLRFADPAGRWQVDWRALLRDGAHHVRQEWVMTAVGGDRSLGEVRFQAAGLDGAVVAGTVDGSPVTCGNLFLGVEDPMVVSEVGEATVVCRLPRRQTLIRGEPVRTSAVFGVAPVGQMRRGFLRYLEAERAHPYRPYLHYNSWYDTAWDPFALNETNCLEAIVAMGERLIRRHEVVLDGLVFDDGWDDPGSLWRFHSGFPRGFAPLAEACRGYGTHLGVWLSPFGGYGEPRERRLRFGAAQGYETNRSGFSLAGPKYYDAFRSACVRMIREFGVNHFKFDGIANGMYAQGGGEYVRDTEAMRRLMLDLRKEDPGVYINLTTGSWPSPFWLLFADSVWRQGGDMGLAGPGTRQQQWLTYRDQEVYRNIVKRGPLYPLNALMTQGVAYSRKGTAGDPSFTSAGFKEDVRAFFGSGTSLQELYIQPDRLNDADWAVLAEAAKWSRANADVFVDTHWIGGDPGRGEVYGYASWSERMGIVMLRNPGPVAADFAFDPGLVFELPPGSARSYRMTSPWNDGGTRAPVEVEAGRRVRLRLEPFEVLVLEARP